MTTRTPAHPAARRAMRVTYGGKPAAARFDGAGRWLSVDLDSDPGSGSMSFHRISPTVVDIVSGHPVDLAHAAAAMRQSARFLTPGVPAVARLEAAARDLEDIVAAGPCPGCGGDRRLEVDPADSSRHVWCDSCTDGDPLDA